ncbi:AraC family transcriptional regulator [Ereboglobus sp. PH5-10]|uniref:helix-turn-helix domain-containing protein n=1 Tax=Ereboglobus sp. PH5-10 TaxID=2940629 RepID=UPI0024050766|nr:AraC family transcriptional regulator [Ereboglobus sp. PH5-10]MDF9828048.1 AraC family transcriptional regulator [Ereboglobus sp. PH5-10]
MPVPVSTSAESFLSAHIHGKVLAASKGDAWQGVKAVITESTACGELLDIPPVSEPYLVWFISGESEVHDREKGGPWIRSIVKKGSFFLSTGGEPYDCRWRALTPEPRVIMHVLLDLSLMKKAYEEVYGIDATHARPRDVSGGEDSQLNALMEQLRDELTRRKASQLLVSGIAQAVAIHLVRKYSALTQQSNSTGSPSLPGFKLRQITDWMSKNLAEEFDLATLSEIAGLSKFHFHRLFKKATGKTPSKYHIDLRMSMARKLLRETRRSVVEIALEVGYANPSHFAKIFRRETGLSPSDYRQLR